MPDSGTARITTQLKTETINVRVRICDWSFLLCGHKQTIAALSDCSREWGRLRSSEVTILVPRARNFPPEICSWTNCREGCVCCNKWFMTESHTHKGQSLWLRLDTRWPPPSKRRIDLHRQQSVHVHGRSHPLIDCFIITLGQTASHMKVESTFVSNYKYFRPIDTTTINNAGAVYEPWLATYKRHLVNC